uniref:Uncharacterized protein n=1 Tax=Rheinheimera sp. BAL341 TaxID=1708203 RepID=A0A486XS34_9GAMM
MAFLCLLNDAFMTCRNIMFYCYGESIYQIKQIASRLPKNSQ